MNKDLCEVFRCPQCGCNTMEVVTSHSVRVNYSNSTINAEIKNGTIECAKCETKFPIKDFIPSFIKLGSTDVNVITEGEYWGKYYNNLFCKEILNFIDIQEPHVPLFPFLKRLLRAPETVSWEKRKSLRQQIGRTSMRIFQNDECEKLLNNEYLNKKSFRGSTVLEVGCGSGWLSLELNRKGSSVLGLDPSFEALRIAKSYAIAKGIHVEYVHSDVALPIFKDDVFDSVFAFHALHHAQDFKRTLVNIKNWLNMNGLFFVYDHRRRTFKPLEITNIIIDLPFLAILDFRFKNEANHLVAIVQSSSPNEDASANSLALIEEYFHVIRKIYFSHFLSDFPRTLLFAFQLGEPAEILGLARLTTFVQELIKTVSTNNCDFVFYIASKRNIP